MEKGVLELLLGQGMSVERIADRIGKHPSTVAYWLDKHGLEAVHRQKHAAKGGIERERLETLVEAGMSTREIATEVGLSQTTVSHWLRRHGLRTRKSRDRARPDASKAAKEAGLTTFVTVCGRHGETEFVLEGRGYYRCKRCRMEAVAARRRRVKAILVAEAGGGCAICGYNRYVVPAITVFSPGLITRIPQGGSA